MAGTRSSAPTLHGTQLDAAYDLMVQIPNMEEAPLPTQSDLDAMLAAFAAAAPAAA